mmetsp:Transcript_24897/g.62624  ORF Transcript_24897/g.62624 Transcript_24897/m.62624 type:complete len:318 (-) Transcript_24897:404-1357(-)
MNQHREHVRIPEGHLEGHRLLDRGDLVHCGPFSLVDQHLEGWRGRRRHIAVHRQPHQQVLYPQEAQRRAVAVALHQVHLQGLALRGVLDVALLLQVVEKHPPVVQPLPRVVVNHANLLVENAQRKHAEALDPMQLFVRYSVHDEVGLQLSDGVEQVDDLAHDPVKPSRGVRHVQTEHKGDEGAKERDDLVQDRVLARVLRVVGERRRKRRHHKHHQPDDEDVFPDLPGAEHGVGEAENDEGRGEGDRVVVEVCVRPVLRQGFVHGAVYLSVPDIERATRLRRVIRLRLRGLPRGGLLRGNLLGIGTAHRGRHGAAKR